MSQKDFHGISFPFRIGQKGGVVMSSTSVSDATHISESIQQILLTFKYERGMEYHIYSELDTALFEPNDVSALTLVEYQIKDAIKRLEDRVEVTNVDVYSENNVLYADISFNILKYNVNYTNTFKVGDINVGNS